MVIARITPHLGFLKDLEVLSPVEAGALRVFGLRGPPRRAKVAYRTLAEALAAGGLAASEEVAHGSVHAIRLMNRGKGLVLIRSGEPIPAGGRAWAVRSSLVLGPQATAKIHEGDFEPARAAPPGSIDDGGHLRLHLAPESSGALFVQGGRVAGLDLFDRRDIFRKCWPSLLAEHAAPGPAAPAESGDASPVLDEAGVAAWLQLAAGARVEVSPSPGLGVCLAIRGEGFAGACLLVGDEPVHLALRAGAEPRAEPKAGAEAVTSPPAPPPGSRILRGPAAPRASPGS